MSGVGDRTQEVQAARETVERLFAAALEAVDPERAVRAALMASGNGRVDVSGESRPIPEGVHLVAIGKAAVAMSRGALAVLDGAIVSGDVITKEGHVDSALPESVRVHEASHPIPDERGVRATRVMLDALGNLSHRVVILALISGGGSALLEAPKDGLTLDDFARTTDILLRAGAPIDALNAVRAPLSRVKAGGLRASAAPNPWITLVLSDVLGNDPRVIASGPTVPGGASAERALAILDRYGVRENVPAAVTRVLESETSAPHDEIHDDLLAIIGDNGAAVRAAEHEAERTGLTTEIAWTAKEGEASELGREFVEIVVGTGERAAVVLGGGEATVTVHGDGIGGRNTEFALAAALEMERRQLGDWVVASLATDGQDALTGMAGAIADAGTAARARAHGVDPEAALRQNDSLAVFEAVGGAIDTGPTGTNVNDLYIAVRLGSGLAGGDKERE
jgi:hydroxypyruvate reductase